jgi:hypothetical protein
MRSKAQLARELVRLGNERKYNTLRKFSREDLDSMLAHAERVTKGLDVDPPAYKHWQADENRAVSPETVEPIGWPPGTETWAEPAPLVSILDAPSELSESEQEDHETPTDCVTPLPVYSDAHCSVPEARLAPISPWWDKWLKLVLRASRRLS